MNHDSITARQETIWLLGALTVPAVQCASRCSWLSAGAVSAAALLVNWLLPRYLEEPGPQVRRLQSLWNCVIIALVLGWVRDSWPSHREPYGASLILLALAAWLAAGGMARGAAVGCVVVWMVWLLLGMAILPVIPEIRWQRLAPRWSMPEGNLLTVLLLPLAFQGRKGKKVTIAAAGAGMAIAAAAMVSGVLSAPVASKIAVPVYEMNRSVSFPVSDIRMESLGAAAITLGCFITVSCLLAVNGYREGKRKVWGYAILSGLVYISPLAQDSRITAIGSILIWMVLPVLENLKKSVKKT